MLYQEHVLVGVLPFSLGAVSVFYFPKQLDNTHS